MKIVTTRIYVSIILNVPVMLSWQWEVSCGWWPAVKKTLLMYICPTCSRLQAPDNHINSIHDVLFLLLLFFFLIRFVGWRFVFPKTNPVSCLLNENMLKKLGKHIQKMGIIFCISWLTQSSLGSWIWYLNLKMVMSFSPYSSGRASLLLSAPSYQNHLTAVSYVLFSLLAAFATPLE